MRTERQSMGCLCPKHVEALGRIASQDEEIARLKARVAHLESRLKIEVRNAREMPFEENTPPSKVNFRKDSDEAARLRQGGARPGHLLRDGHCDGAADAAADYADLLYALRMGGDAEGADEIADVFALLLMPEQLRSGADDLEYDLYRALFGVGAGNGKGYPLPLLIYAQYYELAGPCLFCDKGRLDLHLRYCGVKNLFSDYPVHFASFRTPHWDPLYYSAVSRIISLPSKVFQMSAPSSSSI